MSDLSTEELKTEIHAVLKGADLSVVSTKKVREQVEKKLKCSLLSRKKEFDKIVMDFIMSQEEEEESAEDVDDDEEEDGKGDSDYQEESESDKEEVKAKKPVAKKRGPAAGKSPARRKKKKLTSVDSGSESDDDKDADYDSKKPAKKKKKAPGTTKNGNPRKSTGFTRPYNLSPELSTLMGGAESMPRHEVVKKVWALIKERNLYDPKNKQFAICDDELMKVMKVKRFRTFGMLKLLKPHFLD